MDCKVYLTSFNWTSRPKFYRKIQRALYSLKSCLNSLAPGRRLYHRTTFYLNLDPFLNDLVVNIFCSFGERYWSESSILITHERWSSIAKIIYCQVWILRRVLYYNGCVSTMLTSITSYCLFVINANFVQRTIPLGSWQSIKPSFGAFPFISCIISIRWRSLVLIKVAWNP